MEDVTFDEGDGFANGCPEDDFEGNERDVDKYGGQQDNEVYTPPSAESTGTEGDTEEAKEAEDSAASLQQHQSQPTKAKKEKK